MGNKSSNSEENDQNQLLSKLHQIQEGQDEILRTVAEMSSSENRKVSINDSSILYNEFSPNPILTRIRFSQESEDLYSKLPKELGLDQTLKDAYTKMQITLRNHNTTAASFYLIKQLELLCNSSYLYHLTQIRTKKGTPIYENKELPDELRKQLKKGSKIKSYVPPGVGCLRGKVLECKKIEEGLIVAGRQNSVYDITFENETTRRLSTWSQPPKAGKEILYTIGYWGIKICKKEEIVEQNIKVTPGVKLCLNSIAILNESDEVETRWKIETLTEIKNERNNYAHGNTSKEYDSELASNIEKWMKLLPILVENLPKHKKPESN